MKKKIIKFFKNPYIKFNNNYYTIIFNHIFLSKCKYLLKGLFKSNRDVNLYKELLNFTNAKDKEKNRVILDIGAGIGAKSIIFSRVSDKSIFSFEPFDINYNLLKKNTSKYNKISIFNIGIGTIDGQKKIKLNSLENNSINFGHASFVNFKEDQNIEFSNIAILNNYNSIKKKILKDKKIAFIKIDVEGYEEIVLNQFFPHNNFDTIYEIEISQKYNFDLKKIKLLINKFSYSIYIKKNTKHKISKNDYFLIPEIFKQKIFDKKLNLKAL